ncbi:HNH endonuclease [Janthinobacterium lividum]|uniref:HNH endonuclease n=1 Tax=Janthinobacterium lividum TaxID=29581 RepID=UPI000FE1D74F
MRQSLQKTLFEKYGRTCSYCRRPVGHYGISWHIEHVLPKSKYPSLAFDLVNLTVGCVDCNFWKGRRVDPKAINRKLSIINPLEPDFKYSDHLQYLQISTEDLSFTKYLVKKTPGPETYEKLSFAEIERSHAIDGLDPLTAALHERVMRVISDGLMDPNSQDLLTLLGELKSAIYRRT